MNWYRVKYQIKSWTASAWQADTIFGHLCWGLRYLYGEASLVQFLNVYRNGQPPILLSNGFPYDFLPAPLLPARAVDISLSLTEQKTNYDRQKKARSIHYLPLAEFNSVINGKPIDTEIERPSSAIKSRITVKNQLSRLTSTTSDEGQLFNFEETYIPEVSIYLKLDDNYMLEAEETFRYIASSGYGKRKSVGYGQISDYSLEPFNGFDLPVVPNGFVSLSNFVPAKDDPTSGQWQLKVKYGKMGEAYALEDNAFKNPVLMLEAGAAFLLLPLKTIMVVWLRD